MSIEPYTSVDLASSREGRRIVLEPIGTRPMARESIAQRTRRGPFEFVFVVAAAVVVVVVVVVVVASHRTFRVCGDVRRPHLRGQCSRGTRSWVRLFLGRLSNGALPKRARLAF